MDTSRPRKKNINLNLSQILVVLVAVLFVLVGWLYWDRIFSNTSSVSINSFADCVAAGNPIMESFPEQCSDGTNTFTNPDQVVPEPITSQSGMGAFEVSFPDNWGTISRSTDGDTFAITGDTQPAGATEIVDVSDKGGDGPMVFAITVYDNYAAPQGTAVPYTLVNGKEKLIEGKKYTYYYEADGAIGEGLPGPRLKNDIDYEYVFPLENGQELRVWYSVYGIDPSNHVREVEEIIDSIRLL